MEVFGKDLSGVCWGSVVSVSAKQSTDCANTATYSYEKKRYELDAVSAKNITYHHWCSNHRNVSKSGLPANFTGWKWPYCQLTLLGKTKTWGNFEGAVKFKSQGLDS